MAVEQNLGIIMHSFDSVVFTQLDFQAPHGVQKACFISTDCSSQSVDALSAYNSHALTVGTNIVL